MDRRVRDGRLGLGDRVDGLWICSLVAEDTPESPRSRLLADPGTKQWHDSGVWKTHVAFMAPILATAAAALVVNYGGRPRGSGPCGNVVLGCSRRFSVASIAALVGGAGQPRCPTS